MIEQMAMLKYRSFSFEWRKQTNNKPLHTLLIALVSIGCGMLGETDSDTKEMLAMFGISDTEKGSDGSKFHHQYALSSGEEPINLVEYVTDVLSRTSSHAIQLEDQE